MNRYGSTGLVALRQPLILRFETHPFVFKLADARRGRNCLYNAFELRMNCVSKAVHDDTRVR